MRLALALLGLLICTELHAGAWTVDGDPGQLINNFSFSTSDRSVDRYGDSKHAETYKKWEYNPYFEYGVTNAVTFGLSLSLQDVTQRIANIDEQNANIADSEFFVRTRLYTDGQNVISIQPLIKVPGEYGKNDQPALGQKQFDYEMRLLYGRSFGDNGRHYWNNELAYRLRSGIPGDEWRLATGLGYRLTDSWQILGEAQGTFAADGAGSGNALLSNAYDYDLVKLQLSGLYIFNPKWALQLGVFQTVYERNTGEGTGGLFSVWYRF